MGAIRFSKKKWLLLPSLYGTVNCSQNDKQGYNQFSLFSKRFSLFIFLNMKNSKAKGAPLVLSSHLIWEIIPSYIKACWSFDATNNYILCRRRYLLYVYKMIHLFTNCVIFYYNKFVIFISKRWTNYPAINYKIKSNNNYLSAFCVSFQWRETKIYIETSAIYIKTQNYLWREIQKLYNNFSDEKYKIPQLNVF